jgi:NDP-sugar pyrophosphorylase family protein
MKAVIIAGGEGTRLRPLTYEMPKPLIPVQGKPVMQYLVDNFLAYGCEKVILVINAKQENFFRNWGLVYLHHHKDIDPKRLHLVLETEPLGTLGAIAKAIKGNLEPYEPFFATNADEIKPVNLNELKHAHLKAKEKNEKLVGTITVKEMTEKETYGNVEYQGGEVKCFLEKRTENSQAKFASLGLYILEAKRVLEYYSETQSNTGKNFSMIENDLFPKAAEKGNLGGFEHKGDFYPTDDFAKWEKAILEYKHTDPHYPKQP